MGPSQAKVNAQVSASGGAAATQAQDQLVKDKQRANAMKMIGAKVSSKKVTDKAGITKIAGTKKR